MNVESLKQVREIVEKLGRYVSGRRAYSILKEITLFNRIQGSLGLIQAIETIERILVDETPDNIEVATYKYTGRTGPEWISLPIKWNIYNAEVELGSRRFRFKSHPTLPVAHTPPTDGVVAGEIVGVEDPLNPEIYDKFKDKILLITKHHRIAYRLAAESGVPAIILATRERNSKGFPYIGLFLTEDEAKKYSTTAITLPWIEAEKANGKSIKIRIDSDIGGTSEIPVLTAWIGDSREPGITLIAHICHPSPGANDNASGSSAAIEAFISLAEAIDEGVIREPPLTIRLILIPEYTGTALLMEGWLREKNIASLNLDMVGRRSELAGKPVLHYTPIVTGPSLLGDIYYDVMLAQGIEGTIEYYMAGSDHDVFLGYSQDSVMVNQWPDPFYHTDLDDADTISVDLLEEVALRGAATAYLYAIKYNPSGYARNRLVESLVGKIVSQGGDPSMTYSILSLRYRLGLSSRIPGWSPPSDDRIIVSNQPFYTGILSKRLNLQDKIKLSKELENIKHQQAYNVINEILYAGVKKYTVSRLHTEIVAIYPEFYDYERFSKLLNLLEETGFIRLG